ncbi:helix-turn-helix domain-containing protein [Caballeronia grimmiae]|uniref:helix-turn-helix domain-containing protein n=1 Tax=Caballeronia grimmiae TaxID=1071679 RepID=UPI0009DE6E6C
MGWRAPGDIADSPGVTREAVAAALRRFRDAGLIETPYRRIDVLNIEELRSIVGSH